MPGTSKGCRCFVTWSKLLEFVRNFDKIMASACSTMPSTSGSHNKGGFFDLRKTFEQDINISDWENPWTFYNMFIESDSIWINWLKQQGLLASSMLCRANVGSDGKHPVLCNKPCKFAVRNKVIDGYVWRFTGKERHETSIRHNSFFNNSKHTIPDILNFVKNFLDGHVLRKCAQFTNISYKSTSVNWANFCRDLFVQ